MLYQEDIKRSIYLSHFFLGEILILMNGVIIIILFFHFLVIPELHGHGMEMTIKELIMMPIKTKIQITFTTLLI